MNCRPHGLPSSLASETTLNRLLAVAFQTTLRRQEKSLGRCITKITFRRVHALRVETRRLLAQVALMGGFSAAVKKKFRHALKRTLRATAGMSDARAQTRLLDDVVPGHPELKPFARHLRQMEERAIEFAGRKLQRQKAGARLARLARLLGEPAKRGGALPGVRRRLREAVLALADFTAARRCGPIGLHRARLAVKNVRYMAESLHSALPPSSAAWVERLQYRQRLMGEIHDLDLLAKRLAKYVAKRRPARRELQPVQTLLARRRQQLAGWYRVQRFPSPAMSRWFRHGRAPLPPPS